MTFLQVHNYPTFSERCIDNLIICSYGVVYLVLTTIPNIYLIERHETLGISGLHYIAHGIGAVSAAYFSMRNLDRMYAYLKGRHDGIGEPEFRLRKSYLPLLLRSTQNVVGSFHGYWNGLFAYWCPLNRLVCQGQHPMDRSRHCNFNFILQHKTLVHHFSRVWRWLLRALT
jgi:hypothetical protein